MKANAVPLLAIFEKKMRLEVPLFQRQYVWSREHQWEPLWEDIARKFAEYLEGRKDAPVHFLGAMVLDQKQTPTTHVEKRQVIDGQQRLITLQIFLCAFRDLCRERACEELGKECDLFTLNKGMMAEPEVDKFKVWPTQLGRAQFADVIGMGSRAALEKKHPLTRRPYARKWDPRPRMVEAYLFFHDQLREFFVGNSSDPPVATGQPLAAYLEECFQALKNALQVVVIDLEHDDDPQVIFETLNTRGEPLLPADLLRKFIFLRAARLGESQEALYDQYWRRFDEPFWRQEVRQGRLNRPRSDLFMQHFLASRQTVDIPIKHLFVEYKFWIDRQKPFPTVRDEVATLARQGDDFRRIVEPKEGDILYPLVTFLDRFDIRTTYPLLLHLLDAGLADGQWKSVMVEMGEHYDTVILPRIKKIVFCENWKDGKAAGGQGASQFIKYYRLEQYEDTLRMAKYGDADLFDDPNKDPYHQYVFLRDLKMLEALDVDTKKNKVKVDLGKLYKGIDIAETLSNLTGKWIKRITADSVEFDDGEVVDTKNLDWKRIKPMIWW